MPPMVSRTIYFPRTRMVFESKAQPLTKAILDTCMYAARQEKYSAQEDEQVLDTYFTPLEAAGVFAMCGDYVLCIHRLGYWDLPKGKIEAGETREEAARRELKEETQLDVAPPFLPITATRHTYLLKGQAILKTTYWYLARAEEKKKLVPQAEEGIRLVEWMPVSQLGTSFAPYTYPAILEVLRKASFMIGESFQKID